jgi:signal transduction histidine kinase
VTRTPAQASELPVHMAKFILLGALVALSCWFSISFTRHSELGSTLWVASGLLTGVLVTSPHRMWFGYTIAALLGNVFARAIVGDPWYSVLGLGFTSTLDACVVAFAMARYVKDVSNPAEVKVAGWVAVSSSFVASALSALLAASIVAVFGVESFGSTFGNWFVSHFLGMVIFATLIGVALQRGRRLFGKPGRRVEFALIVALLAAVCVAVFAEPDYPLEFLVYPPLLFCAFRYRFDGAILGLTVVVVVATTATLSGHGPLYFVPGAGPAERAFLLQIFLAVTCLLTLPVAIVLTESGFLARSLRESERRHRVLAQSLEQHNVELEAVNQKLAGAQTQLLQSEKMASVGQLAAGVAHEINNPIGYVRSNLTSLTQYWQNISLILEAYEQLETLLPGMPPQLQAVQTLKQRVELDYLRQDIVSLLAESVEGVTRVEKIVKDLRDFSHIDQGEWVEADIHECIDSTLNVVAHELKYKGDLIKEYGELPLIPCLPFQLKQVFMNLLVNAAQAIAQRGTITIRTEHACEHVRISIADTGRGIAPDHLKRIFEPFFTTKPIGVGTGLGLSVSYGIIQKHGGTIEVASDVGKGTTFTVCLPMVH